MDDTVRFKLLSEVAEKLGIEVRHEEVKTEDSPSPGGLCRIAGKYILIINTKATVKEKSLVMIEAFRQFDLGNIYIRPAIRELLDESRERDMDPNDR